MTAAVTVEIRPANEDDVELIYSLIVALAEYEHAPEQVVGTPELLRKWLFGDAPAAETVIAEVDGEPAGFAMFHGTFSTWECQPGLWLEDLFVLPEQRRHGVGGKLLSHVAKIAVDRGHTRMGWAALDWNEMALGFYRKLGAAVLDEWKMHRLSGQTLQAVASAAGSAAG
ncbi:MAG TPA: GNAT family N-acetyltransferase [Solirubrobacteraceae bacterium]|nr:GNAT family N-acetyltransferase [Solirubrobacteraceae bacterium]